MYSMLAVSLESLKICIACGIPQRDKHATLPVQPHRGANGDLSVAVALEVVVRLLVPAARHGQCQLGLLVTRVPFVLLNDLTSCMCYNKASHHHLACHDYTHAMYIRAGHAHFCMLSYHCMHQGVARQAMPVSGMRRERGKCPHT